MNPAWWTRLCDRAASAFSRDPPHLRGRAPVYCGAGVVTNRPMTSVGVAWSPPPDEQGRAAIRRAADLGVRRTYDRDTQTLTVEFLTHTPAGRAAYERHLREQLMERRYMDPLALSRLASASSSSP